MLSLNMKYHYTYRITNIKEGMYYYGVHSCDCLPKEDIGIKYLSSSTNINFIKDQKENPHNYKYKIVKIFNTRKEANKHEELLHKKFNVIFNEKFYNKWNSNSTWTTAGLTGVTEISTSDRIMITVEEYKNNKHLYIAHAKNKVVSLDLRYNINKIVSKEEFDNNDFYVGASYNNVSCLDLRDSKTKKITKEEFDNNDFYVGVSKNKVLAKDLNTGECITISKEEFESNTNYVGITTGKFVAIDSMGELHHIYNNDLRYLSGELTHHSKILISITDGNQNKRVKPGEIEKYINDGWLYGVTQFTEKPNACCKTKYMNKDGIRKRIKNENVEEYTNNGWSIGLPKMICSVCGATGAGSAMYRFHFENCKNTNINLKLKEINESLI